MTVQVERAEPGLADFYATKQPWVKEAACHRQNAVFYAAIDAETLEERAASLVASRALCAGCAVRVECGSQAQVEEQGAALISRFGVRAWMTPAQRVSVERRGGLHGRDPMLLMQGRDGKRVVPCVPDDGDRWSRHHTTLARKALKWVVENVKVGQRLPSQQAICKALGCNAQPLRRVMEALVQDGTLDFSGTGPRTRGGNGLPLTYVRRAAPSVIGSWLPQHQRVTT